MHTLFPLHFPSPQKGEATNLLNFFWKNYISYPILQIYISLRLQTWKTWRDGTASNLVDPQMRIGSGSHEIMRCIHIGLLCVQENVVERPTMNTIVLMLNSYSLSLPVPSQPGFFMHSIGSDMSLATQSNSGDFVQASRNEATITELYPR